MNITFLIGNGFDLNIGLKTTYSEFLKRYIIESNVDGDLIKYFKTVILKDTHTWSNAERAFGEATRRFKEDGYTAEEFCQCHEDFCVKLAEYLIEEELRLDYLELNDIIALGFAKGVLGYRRNLREAEREAIMAAEKDIGNAYIFNFISFNYTSVLDMCVDATQEQSSLLGKRTYGNTNYYNQLGKVLHVHGTVRKDMVLGVNDISQIAEPALFNGFDEEYINEMIKPKTNEINEENSDQKAFELLKSSDLIYVYGMSLGETDKLWWERIYELMERKGNLHLIVHSYDAPEDGLIRRAFRMYANSVRKIFIEFSCLDEGKKKAISDRIHIDRTNIFEELNMLVDSQDNYITPA